MADAVTTCVRALVKRGVTQFDELEVLLELAADNEGRAPPTAPLGIRAYPTRVSAALAGLEQAGMIVRMLRRSRPAYQIDRDLDVGALLALHATHACDRTRVMNAFYACSIENLREFVRGIKLRVTA